MFTHFLYVSGIDHHIPSLYASTLLIDPDDPVSPTWTLKSSRDLVGSLTDQSHLLVSFSQGECVFVRIFPDELWIYFGYSDEPPSLAAGPFSTRQTKHSDREYASLVSIVGGVPVTLWGFQQPLEHRPWK